MADWLFKGGKLDCVAPRVMGILNLTPDSFSDGGACLDFPAALERFSRLEADGADIIDLGAESTRPGSRPVIAEEETRRLMPVLEKAVARTRVPISVDTSKVAVARRALDAGAAAINDVTGGRDPAMFELAARTGAGLVLMHMRGTPETMQIDPCYDDVVGEILAFLRARVAAAESVGMARAQLVVDPGIGFGKNLEHNLLLLKHAGRFADTGCPVLVGPSRKGFIGTLTGAPVNCRGTGTVAAVVSAWLAGAHIFRVHDVMETKQALAVARAISRAGEKD